MYVGFYEYIFVCPFQVQDNRKVTEMEKLRQGGFTRSLSCISLVHLLTLRSN
jgi:hypothetical protein